MNRYLITAGLFGLLSLAAGCGKTTFNHPQYQPSCTDDGGKLNSVGLCVQCVANADCPAGQICELISGTCQNAPPPPVDGGVIPTCQLGAKRCATDLRSVQECVRADGGNDWENQTVCTDNQVCNPKTLTCAICAPGETICDDSDTSATFTRCDDQGVAFDPMDCTNPDAGGRGPGFYCHQLNAHQDAADGGDAVPATSICRICQPGTVSRFTAEDGGVGILTCDSTGTDPEFASCWPTNEFAAYTDGGLVDPPQCKPSLCYPGQHRCTGTANSAPGRETCNADGSAWVADNCAADQVCGPTPIDNGACLSPCEVAESTNSYVGCDYWGTLMSNKGLEDATPFIQESNGLSEFSLVVGNTSDTLTAVVTVTSLNDGSVYSQQVSPHQVGVVQLPWLAICGTGAASAGYHLTSTAPVTVYQFNPLHSAVTVNKPGTTSSSCTTNTQCQASCCSVNGGAACSNRADAATCKNTCTSGQCREYAFTDDASLLLPTHLLDRSYVVVSEDTEAVSNTADCSNPNVQPGSFSVVASHDNTHVEILFAGDASATPGGTCSTVGGEIGLGALHPGQPYDFTLNAGTVIQFWGAASGNPQHATNTNGSITCLYPNDLTGTIVSSDQPVAVFGGADCTFKPYNKFACDHIEEEMFPFSTWGKTYVGVKSHAYDNSSGQPVSNTYPDFWRVVSGCGPTTCPTGVDISISPAISPGTSPASPPGSGSPRNAPSCSGTCSCTTNGNTTTCHLPPVGAGETAPWIEFQHNGSFTASSNQSFVLAQYFSSEDEAGTGISQEGDPSLVLVPPVEQWRTDYTVLAPTSYVHNYLNLAVNDPNHSASPNTAQVLVDGVVVPASEWHQITGTTYWYAQHTLSNSGTGSHTIATNNGVKVGVVVYGYDQYVSYGYTGGLDLTAITTYNPGQ